MNIKISYQMVNPFDQRLVISDTNLIVIWDEKVSYLDGIVSRDSLIIPSEYYTCSIREGRLK